MRLRLLVVITFVFGLAGQAKADSTYGFSLGVALQNTVVPGSLVSINAVLLNTGSSPILFAPSFPGGTPSVEGGSAPFAGISADGQWNILDDGFSFGNFVDEFAGVTVEPGASFDFIFGTFRAPTDQPLGFSSTAQLNFGIDFTDAITGNLLTDCRAGCNLSNLPRPSFTLANAASASDTNYFQAVMTGGELVSVPEPPVWEMLSTTAATLAAAIALGERRRRKPTAV